MELKNAVLNRRSIRKFLKKKIPEELIQELISASLWAPSWGNTQPWELMVVTGPPLERFKKENKEALFACKKPNPDIPMPQVWPDAMKRRYVEVGKSVLQSLSIGRKDLDGRMAYYGDMFSLFDAPVLLLVLLDKSLLLEYAMLDVGLFLQTFQLAAHDKGLGTVTLAAAVNYPDLLRNILPIDDSKRIVIGTAMGWPDLEAPVNLFERQRTSWREAVVLINA